MSNEFIPYKDVPREDLIKALHLMLFEIDSISNTSLDVMMGAARFETLPRQHELDTKIRALLRCDDDMGFSGYKNVPETDFLKALHLMLVNIHNQAYLIIKSLCSEAAYETFGDSRALTQEQVASLLQSTPEDGGACSSPTASSSTSSSVRDQYPVCSQSLPPVDSENRKDY